MQGYNLTTSRKRQGHASLRYVIRVVASSHYINIIALYDNVSKTLIMAFAAACSEAMHWGSIKCSMRRYVHQLV